MDWMNWKTWTAVGGLILMGFAIYLFAGPQVTLQPLPKDPVVAVDGEERGAPRPSARSVPPALRTPGVEPVHTEWLDTQNAIDPSKRNPYGFPGGVRAGVQGNSRSNGQSSHRNLFAFPVPPPPPPPPIPKPPPPPPDRDKDGIPDFRDNCPDKYNPDQTDIDHNGIGAACQATVEIAPPPPPPPPPVPPAFSYKYIGTFGSAANPIATFNGNGQIINVRVGGVIDGKFVLRSIGIESVEIGFIGFPPDQKQRIPLGQ